MFSVSEELTRERIRSLHADAERARPAVRVRAIRRARCRAEQALVRLRRVEGITP